MGFNMHIGQCLCGAVTLSTPKSINEISACHCRMCQKWNSGPAMSVDCGDEVTLSGEESITYYASSDFGERAFCQQCGTHLFYHLLTPSTYYVSAGLFVDENEEIKDRKLAMQIFVDSKPQYYNFVEKTPMLTAEDIMNMFKY